MKRCRYWKVNNPLGIFILYYIDTEEERQGHKTSMPMQQLLIMAAICVLSAVIAVGTYRLRRVFETRQLKRQALKETVDVFLPRGLALEPIETPSRTEIVWVVDEIAIVRATERDERELVAVAAKMGLSGPTV